MMKILQEYRASDWKISQIDPDTSGKYVFDGMTYAPGRCENCGHPIKWNVHIHDAEDPDKAFVVGDDCIEFLLAIRGGLENTQDLELFRGAKTVLVRFFHWLFKHNIDTGDLTGVAGFLDPADKSGITFLPISEVNGHVKVDVTRDGRPYRPYKLEYSEFDPEEWLKFYPKLSQVLLSYDGKYFVSANNVEHFKALFNAAVQQAAPAYSWTKKYDEKEADTALGTIKSIRTGVGTYNFIGDKRLTLPRDLPQLGCVWDDSLKPMYPDCQLDMDTFLTVSKNVDTCKALCLNDPEDWVIQRIEEWKTAQQKKDAEDAARKDKEARLTAMVDGLVADPQKIIDGMKGHCVSNWWVDHNVDTLRQTISAWVKQGFDFNGHSRPVNIRLDDCSSTFRLRFPEQIATLKKMDYYSKGRYLRNIVGKITQKFHIDTTWTATIPGAELKYAFEPNDIFEFNGNTGVKGNVIITITPTIQESTKVTLTLGQLKKLLEESSSAPFEPSQERGFRPTVEWMKEKYTEMNKWLFDGKLGSCEMGIFTHGQGSQGRTLGKFRLAAKGIRISRSNGRMYMNDSWMTDPVYIDEGNFVDLCNPTILLNGNYSGTERAFLATLVHEMCHYYTYRRGWCPLQGHGREFKAIAARVSAESGGLFTIQRLASAEDMKEYDLDDEFKAKKDRRLANKKDAMKVLLVITKSGEARLTLSKSDALLEKITKWGEEHPGYAQTIKTDSNKALDFLFAKGYTKAFRTWRWWNIQDRPWYKDFKKLLDDLPKDEKEDLTYIEVQPRAIAEEQDDPIEVTEDAGFIEIDPTMDLGAESPLEDA